MDWPLPELGQSIMADSNRSNPIPTALLLMSLTAGAWYFFKNFQIQGLDQISVSGKAGGIDSPEIQGFPNDSFLATKATDWLPDATSRLTVTPVSTGSLSSSRTVLNSGLPATRNLRIATWALGGLGPDKIDSVATFDRVASVIRGFDLVAIQQLRATQQDFLPQLMERASGSGRRYDYLVGPVQQPSGEQLAFFFDTNRLVTDRSQLYSVADPENRLTHDPLVGWFQSIGLPPNAAWTFSFINVRIELPRARLEVAELPRILGAVARDGRGEDDCLMGGLFQSDDVYLMATLQRPAMQSVIKGMKTDIFARHQTSNLVYSNSTTTEAIGRGGVFDFLRSENLSLAEAEQVSPYLPVFADFSPREGGER